MPTPAPVSGETELDDTAPQDQFARIQNPAAVCPVATVRRERAIARGSSPSGSTFGEDEIIQLELDIGSDVENPVQSKTVDRHGQSQSIGRNRDATRRA